MNKDRVRLIQKNKFKLNEILNLDDLEVLFKKFSKATGHTISLSTYPDDERYLGIGWRSLCTKFHRQNVDLLRNCNHSKSELTLNLNQKGQINIKKCLNGIFNGATLVMVEGERIAYLKTGQVFIDKESKDKFISDADSQYFETTEYLQAIEETPIVSEEEFKNTLLFLAYLVESNAKKGILNLDNKDLEQKITTEKEEKLTILNKFPYLVFTLNTEGQILDFVPSDQVNLKFISEIAIGKKIDSVLPRNMGEQTVEMLDRLFEEKKEQSFEYSPNLEKEAKYFKASLYVKNNKEAILTIFNDSLAISNRKKLNHTLNRQNALLSANPDMIMEIDQDKKFVFANKASLNFFGEDILSRNIDDYLADPSEQSRPIESHFEDNKELVFVENWQKRLDNISRLLTWHIQPIRNDFGEVTGAICNARDITNGRETQSELIKNKKLLETITESTSSGLLIYQDSKVVYFNTSLLNILKSKKENFLGKDIRDFIFEDDKPVFDSINSKLFKSGYGESNPEIRFVNEENEVVWVNCNVKIIRWKGSKAIISSVTDISKRKTVEKRLENRELIFRNMFEQHSASILLINPEDGQLIGANQASADFYGWTMEELQEMNIADLSVSSNEQIGSVMKSILNKKAHHLEFVHKKKDGSLVDVEVFSNSVTVGSKKFLHSIIVDVSEKKRAIQQAFKLNRAVENSSSAVVMTDVNGTIEYVNPAFETITGHNAKSAIGRNPRILNANIQSEAYYKDMWDTILSGQVWKSEIQNKKKDGSLFWEKIVISPIFGKNKTITNFVAVKEDITANKRILRQLRKSERYYRTLINKSTDVISTIDKKGRIIYESSSVLEVLGYEPNEILGQYLFDFIHPSEIDQTSRLLSEFIDNPNEIKNVNFRFRHKDGYWLHIEGVGRNLLDDPDIKGILFNYRDVSSKINLMNDLVFEKKKAIESDNLKTAFLQNMSHEIRTPLNGILGFSKLLQTNTFKGESVKEYAGIINESGTRLLDLINNILNISKIEAGTVNVHEETFSLHEFLSKIIQTFSLKAEALNIGLNLEFDQVDTSPLINTDAGKFSQILINLINNALKFTKEGEVSCSYKIKGAKIVFEVKDTGIGISKIQQEKVFNRFYQVQDRENKEFEGAGLGLAITNGLVNILKGEIWLESKLGEGTSFFFTIPYITQTQKNNIKSTLPNQLLNRRINILIAEDSNTNFLLIKTQLEKFNVKISHAENGQEAVDFCRNNDKIDIILMDINMPVLDGISATKIISQEYPGIPILAQTAYAYKSDQDKVLKAGCADFIAKPYKQKELFNKIAALVN